MQRESVLGWHAKLLRKRRAHESAQLRVLATVSLSLPLPVASSQTGTDYARAQLRSTLQYVPSGAQIAVRLCGFAHRGRSSCIQLPSLLRQVSVSALGGVRHLLMCLPQLHLVRRERHWYHGLVVCVIAHSLRLDDRPAFARPETYIMLRPHRSGLTIL